MRNTGLEEAQAGIKIAGRNINNLRYADDTTLMAEGEEELKSLLMKVEVESEKVGLKLNIQKMKIMASSRITSWEIDEIISSSVVPFSSYSQSFPASRSFPLSKLFTSGGQSLGASASASVLPMNIHN